METELITKVDENRRPLGTAPRSEIHEEGHWHETFHCWLVSKENETDMIYFQIRSEVKKDFPGLLDITAAGHILAHETVQDGIREVQEELGIDVSMDDLEPLGVIENSITTKEIIDREWCHVFLYRMNETADEFKLQKEEVSGILKANFSDFYKLWLGQKEEIRAIGFHKTELGNKVAIDKHISKNDFVPHQPSYLENVVKSIQVKLTGEPVIREFSKEDQSRVIDLILPIQQEEYNIPITKEDQPDLFEIETFYQTGSGNFWTAHYGNKVIGTISLLDIGNQEAALRKMFVAKEFRGPHYKTASLLLQHALNWAKEKTIKTVYLGTTPQFLAAHRFYEKNGFIAINEEELPEIF